MIGELLNRQIQAAKSFAGINTENIDSSPSWYEWQVCAIYSIVGRGRFWHLTDYI